MAVRPRNSLLSTFLMRLRARREDPPQRAAPQRLFQAVSIYRGTNACDRARRISEHRFLSKNAPTLPLPGCSMPESCECRYLKHRDRRGVQRRLIDYTTSRVYAGVERRMLKGRRATD